MELWIAIRGAYEDQQVVGIATSEARAEKMLRDLGVDTSDSYEGITWGPYALDQLQACREHNVVAHLLCGNLK